MDTLRGLLDPFRGVYVIGSAHPCTVMPAATEPTPAKSNLALVAIGVFKLVKCVSLFALGVALVHWRGQDLGVAASLWLNDLWVGRSFVDKIVLKLSSLDGRTIDEIAVGSFMYAVLLLVEGIGLCRRKRWAEFLTVGITASLLPFELYELTRRLTLTRAIIMAANLGILWYLIVQLSNDRTQHLKSKVVGEDT
jgi:uncharacterized membrane protein (DUF2068 family)